jgi:hypothetical protein
MSRSLPELTSLREDADPRPIRSATWAPGVPRNIAWSHLIEHEDDLGMAELVEAKQSLRIEYGRV